MNLSQRSENVSGKVKYYFGEMIALNSESLSYKVGFGLFMVFLFPFLLFELIVVLFFGKDLSLFARPKSVLPLVLVEEEVPISLRDLIPLAKKYGISDDGERGDVMKAASPEELLELEQKVSCRQQDISDWLDTFPEGEITDTAAFYLYLGSACDEVPEYRI